MKFVNVNIPQILKSAMANKFMDFSPQDFEEFITQLFKDNGYHSEHTKLSGDYGVDVIIKKGEEHIAVQVKRYSHNNKVGVKDVNQVLGGRDYYKCKSARVITTSSYTNPVKKLAKETGVELWDWSTLQKYICDTYLDGKDYYEYFKKQLPHVTDNSNDFEFAIKKIDYEKDMKGGDNCTLIYMTLKNNSDKNLDVNLGLPTVITINNKQIKARWFMEGHFTGGKIYSGCKVDCCFCFISESLPKLNTGDKIILEINSEGKDEEIILVFNQSKKREEQSSGEDIYIFTPSDIIIKKTLTNLLNNGSRGSGFVIFEKKYISLFGFFKSSPIFVQYQFENNGFMLYFPKNQTNESRLKKLIEFLKSLKFEEKDNMVLNEDEFYLDENEGVYAQCGEDVDKVTYLTDKIFRQVYNSGDNYKIKVQLALKG